MKQIYILAFTILFLGCQKEDPPLFTITIPLSEFVIESTFGTFDIHYVPANNGTAIFTSVQQQFAEAGYDINDIDRIEPGEARFSSVFNQSRLNFIQAMSIRICKEADGADCGKEVFYRDPVPEDAGFSMGLIPSAIGDVQDIIGENQIFIQLKLERLWVNPPTTFEARLEMDFDVR